MARNMIAIEVKAANSALKKAIDELRAACTFDRWGNFVSCSVPILPAEPGHGLAITRRTRWNRVQGRWHPVIKEKWITTEHIQRKERALARAADPFGLLARDTEGSSGQR